MKTYIYPLLVILCFPALASAESLLDGMPSTSEMVSNSPLFKDAYSKPSSSSASTESSAYSDYTPVLYAPLTPTPQIQPQQQVIEYIGGDAYNRNGYLRIKDQASDLYPATVVPLGSR